MDLKTLFMKQDQKESVSIEEKFEESDGYENVIW